MEQYQFNANLQFDQLLDTFWKDLFDRTHESLLQTSESYHRLSHHREALEEQCFDETSQRLYTRYRRYTDQALLRAVFMLGVKTGFRLMK